MIEVYSYRDNELGLRVRRDELYDARMEDAALLPRDLRRIYARRISRTVGGTAAVVGALSVVVVTALTKGAEVIASGPVVAGLEITPFLVATCALVPIIMIVAHVAAHLHFPALMRTGLNKSSDVRADLARFEAETFLAWASRQVDAPRAAERVSSARGPCGSCFRCPRICSSRSSLARSASRSSTRGSRSAW